MARTAPGLSPEYMARMRPGTTVTITTGGGSAQGPGGRGMQSVLVGLSQTMGKLNAYLKGGLAGNAANSKVAAALVGTRLNLTGAGFVAQRMGENVGLGGVGGVAGAAAFGFNAAGAAGAVGAAATEAYSVIAEHQRNLQHVRNQKMALDGNPDEGPLHRRIKEASVRQAETESSWLYQANDKWTGFSLGVSEIMESAPLVGDYFKSARASMRTNSAETKATARRTAAVQNVDLRAAQMTFDQGRAFGAAGVEFDPELLRVMKEMNQIRAQNVLNWSKAADPGYQEGNYRGH